MRLSSTRLLRMGESGPPCGVPSTTNTPSAAGRQGLSMSREAVQHLNQHIRVGTDRDGALAVRRRCGGRPDCANTGRSPTACRTGHIDPLLPFEIGSAPQAQRSGGTCRCPARPIAARLALRRPSLSSSAAAAIHTETASVCRDWMVDSNQRYLSPYCLTRSRSFRSARHRQPCDCEFELSDDGDLSAGPLRMAAWRK